jgi:hypothetical protein
MGCNIHCDDSHTFELSRAGKGITPQTDLTLPASLLAPFPKAQRAGNEGSLAPFLL